jgi:hypothetical protein
MGRGEIPDWTKHGPWFRDYQGIGVVIAMRTVVGA